MRTRLLLLLLASPHPADGPERASAVDRAAYVTALATGECGTVQVRELADDCWLAVAVHAHACAALPTATAAAECWFLTAERTGDSSLCGLAGPFADDCARHLFIAELPRRLPARRVDDHNDAAVQRMITRLGLAPDAMRPWLEYYKWAGGGAAMCDGVADRQRRKACTAAIAELARG